MKEDAWTNIVLEPESRAAILEALGAFERGETPRDLLLYGPAGTGKTEIKKAIAESLGCSSIDLALADFEREYLGASGMKVRKAWNEARGEGRCLMFLDGVEGIFPRRGSSERDSRELVAQFLTEWEGVRPGEQHVWVIGETYDRDLVDEALLSRFELQVQTKKSSAEDQRK